MTLADAGKALVLPVVALADATEPETKNVNKQSGGGGSEIVPRSKAKFWLAYVINLIMAAGAAYLAWRCNIGQTSIMRIVYTVLAAMFNGLYLIYYVIYHVIMANPC